MNPALHRGGRIYHQVSSLGFFKKAVLEHSLSEVHDKIGEMCSTQLKPFKVQASVHPESGLLFWKNRDGSPIFSVANISCLSVLILGTEQKL